MISRRRLGRVRWHFGLLSGAVGEFRSFAVGSLAEQDRAWVWLTRAE